MGKTRAGQGDQRVSRGGPGLPAIALPRPVGIGTIQAARLDPWTQPLRVPADGGDYELHHGPAPDSLHDPAHYHLTPADEIRIAGSLIRERQRKDGIGAPVVAIERGTDKHAREDSLMPKIHYGVTALIRFEGHRAVISFEDPLAVERVTFAGHSFPLAADFTAPIAVLVARQNPRKHEIEGLLHPADDEAAHLMLTKPFDPDKTVVLIIHGLKSTPATWVPMLNHLQADEELRRNYQVWLYGYPSGYPYSHSAAILRRELDAIQSRYPLREKMVVIGHSMGGCISRLLITDTGDKLWRGVFGTPPGQTPLPELDAARRRLARSETLSQEGAETMQKLDDDRAAARSAEAALTAAKAQVAAAQAAIVAAETEAVGAGAAVKAGNALVARIAADIEDSKLKAPRDGRVQFKVSQPGEVLSAGGKVLNLVDLTDVYMTFFLPEAIAGRLAMGAEARIVLDAAPQWVIPARVTFVADVAQYTPKTVETETERQKLMFRVRAHIPEELLREHMDLVKTGLPGVAYVRWRNDVEWPPHLEPTLDPALSQNKL